MDEMATLPSGVTMEWFRIVGSDVTDIHLRITDKVLVGADLNELDRVIVHQASEPDATIADKLLALEALVRAAENGS